jgi:hypothetical protein
VLASRHGLQRASHRRLADHARRALRKRTSSETRDTSSKKLISRRLVVIAHGHDRAVRPQPVVQLVEVRDLVMCEIDPQQRRRHAHA